MEQIVKRSLNRDGGVSRRCIGEVADLVVDAFINEALPTSEVLAFKVLLSEEFHVEVGRRSTIMVHLWSLGGSILQVELKFGQAPRCKMVILKSNVSHPRGRKG